jgi:hypothetical protein
MKMRFGILGVLLVLSSLSSAQIPGVKLPGIPGVSDIFRKGPAITTSIKDAKFEAVDKDSFIPTCNNLADLKRGPSGGFILQEGAWGGTMQSYCLHAGTYGPTKGDGYLYAPVKGPLEKIVQHVVQRSVEHPEIDQPMVQQLLWAIVARAKYNDMAEGLRAAGSKLLTPREMSDLNGGALGMLSENKIAGSFIKEPEFLRPIYEAEARLRNTFASPNATYADMERIAVLNGTPPIGPGSRDVPSGRWSLHPDGYYVRFIPSGYPTTRLEIFVPEGAKCIGKEFDPAVHIAAPCNTARQRLIQSARFQA